MPRDGQRPGRCTYCLQNVDGITDEHVVARSWYTGAAANTPKPQVPACQACNNGFSRPEDRLRERFVLAYAAGDERVADIQKRALRGIDPSSTTDPRERRIRMGRRDRIAREAIELREMIANAPPGVGAIPGFGSDDQPDPALQYPVRIDKADLVAVAEKIVRGLLFYLSGRLVEPPYEVEVVILRTEAREHLLAKIASSPGALTVALGEGFRFTAAPIADDDPLAVLCDLHIWGRLNVTAFVRRTTANPSV